MTMHTINLHNVQGIEVLPVEVVKDFGVVACRYRVIRFRTESGTVQILAFADRTEDQITIKEPAE